jgi:hypothetical protein
VIGGESALFGLTEIPRILETLGREHGFEDLPEAHDDDDTQDATSISYLHQ